jgi:methyl-accepting chemotaxis protein
VVLSAPVSLFALESIPVDASFDNKTIGTFMEYLEDKDKLLTIDTVKQNREWSASNRDSFNFGFTKSVYWYRFAIDNKSAGPLELLFELTYPLLNYVDFYVPVKGRYEVIKTGNRYAFYQRPIEDKNIIFQLKEGPGTHAYYMRIETTGSMNFMPNLMSQNAYLKRNQTQMPIIWIYYGLMMIMVVYNFIIFIASRDRAYVFYVLFIAVYILFQMTLNGYSFQYLWPNSTWWGANSLPFFMCMTILFCGIFVWDIVDMRKNFKIMHKICVFGVMVPSLIWAVASLIVPYATAIRIATALIGVTASILHVMGWIALFRGSRPARFITIGFVCLVSGVVVYVLKSFGVLPEMFITEWGIQIGSALVVISLSLGLSDKINVMRKELQVLLAEQRENEKTARERAGYLEGIVGTATGLTGEFIHVSEQLQDITNRFSDLAMEQASTSEEMSSTFEELSAAVETIYQSTITQKGEGEKSKHLVDELNVAQKDLIQESQKVEESIKRIMSSATTTGDSLRQMADTMNIINTGGAEINKFIAMIDDISDRINLLSLNAAIEAARAGDYGRGFAVVADEIGKLAQATSDNSKEIGKQISKIISDIEAGARIVTGTKESTDVIFKMVNAIGSGVNAVREMMLKQNQALEMVIHEAGVIDAMSKDIVTSTNEQKNSMTVTQKTIDRLAEMAMEISHSNSQIIDFSKVIHEKALQLDGVIRKQA